MRKRLRKKKHLGEFRENCFAITFLMNAGLSIDGRNALLDRFIEMIESAGLQFGGGGAEDKWSGFVEIFGHRTVTAANRDHVLNWMTNENEIRSASASDLFDCYYGETPESWPEDLPRQA